MLEGQSVDRDVLPGNRVLDFPSVTPEAIKARPSVQRNAETYASQSEMPLKIRGATPRKADWKKPDSSADFSLSGVPQDGSQIAT